jgi:RNA polymerase sigma-70 factor (ECF subfamily)
MSAFDRIMQRYKRPILDFAYRMTANPDAAADIAQEVFVRAWRPRLLWPSALGSGRV